VSKKAWIIFAAVCVALLAVLIYMSSKDRVDVGNTNTNTILGPTEQSGSIGDHVFGKADSKVVFIEYGDFQCPGCGKAYPTIKKLTEKYKDQIAFVFRNYPIVSIHPNARAAAGAAEAAGLQGKYWEMHSMLYESQSAWQSLGSKERTDFFVEYAKELGLNAEVFTTDFASTKVNQKISFDQALGKKANVSATPTLFLNGKQIQQETWDDEVKFDEAFVAAMKENGITVPETKN
jgi:protein-disulfide isomerase